MAACPTPASSQLASRPSFQLSSWNFVETGKCCRAIVVSLPPAGMPNKRGINDLTERLSARRASRNPNTRLAPTCSQPAPTRSQDQDHPQDVTRERAREAKNRSARSRVIFSTQERRVRQRHHTRESPPTPLSHAPPPVECHRLTSNAQHTVIIIFLSQTGGPKAGEKILPVQPCWTGTR